MNDDLYENILIVLKSLKDAIDDYCDYDDYCIQQNHIDEAKLAISEEIEKKASELEVTVDYYLAEFVWIYELSN